MPGTLLSDDLQSSIEDQLHQHITNLLSGAQQTATAVVQPVQAIGANVVQAPAAIQTAVQQAPQTAQDVQQALNAHIDQLTQAAQQQAQQAQQDAVQVLGGAQQSADQVKQQLLDHIDQLGGAASGGAQQALGAVQSLAPQEAPAMQPITPQAPTLGGAAGGGNAPTVTTLGGTDQTQAPTVSTAGGSPASSSPIAAAATTIGQGKDAFLQSLAGLAQANSQQTGIDPAAYLAIAANETGWGRSQTAQQQNNLFSIQGSGANGSRWAGYDSPQAAFDAFNNLIQTAPRYAQAWADRADPSKFVDDLRNAGYVVDEPGYPAQGWVNQVKSIYGDIKGTVGSLAQQGAGAVQTAAQNVQQAVTTPSQDTGRVFPVVGYNDKVQDHWGSVLGGSDLMAPRGTPVVAMEGGKVVESGWNSVGGNSVLIQGRDGNQYYYAHFDKAPSVKVGDQVDAGTYLAPVGNTGDASGGPTHLHIGIGPDIKLGADKYGGTGGDYDAVGLLRQTLAGQQQGGGGQTEQAANTATGPAAIAPPTPAAKIQARGPIVMGAMQDAQGNTVADQGPTPIQSLGETIGTAINQAVQQAVQQATGALGGAGQAAQNVVQGVQAIPTNLGQQTERLRGELGQTSSDLGSAAQGAVQGAQQTVAPVLGAAQQVGAAIGPNLGFDDAELQRRRAALDQNQELGARAATGQPGPITPESTLGGLAQTAIGPAFGTVQSPEQIRKNVDEVSSGLQANNPIRDVLVVGGLSNMLIDQVVQNPLVFVPGAPLGEAINSIGGSIIADVAPRLGPVASRLGAAAINGGVQNAIYEMGQQNATPLSVGTAFLQGAGIGAGIDIAPTVAAEVGRSVLKRVPDIVDAVTSPEVQAAPDVQPASNPLVTIGSNDATYRTTHALTNWIAREFNIPPEQAQAAGWTVYRTLSNDPVIGPELRNDRISLGDALAQGQQAGLLDPAKLAFAAPATAAAQAESAAGATRPEPSSELGFRAPLTAEDLNVRQVSPAEARRLVGPAYDPSGRVLGGGEEVPGAEPGGPAARNLSDVHSNPHLLRDASPGETPMTTDERVAHQGMLEQRYQANAERLASIDEQLRNPNQKPVRPPWGAGWTNDQLVRIAQAHDESAYSPLWWERAGLDVGSGEVRENVGQGGFRNTNVQREPTPAELRAERNVLAQDQRDLEAAGEQSATAPDSARLVRRTQTPADLPFAGGEESHPHGPFATENAGPSTLAEDIVTQNGRKDYGSPLRDGPGEVVATGTRGGREVTGRGISDAEAAAPGTPTEATRQRMPNLDAMLKGEMPEVRAQIQKAAEDNPALFDAYQQGRISHDSLLNDLANKVGMSKADFLKTPVGKGFSTPELVALQAAAIDAQGQSEQLARDIAARGGVDALTPEETAHGVRTLLDNARLLAVARGGRATAGRSLNALKNRMDATMAQGITASNDRIAALRAKAQAAAAVKRANTVLDQAKALDQEKTQAVSNARRTGVSGNILQQIEDAYAQLDRYQAMSLHEKADDWAALQKQRAEAAANRKAKVRDAPQELLSALQAELKAERDNFAKRKDTWETMAFWDSKANENAVAKRNAFRGGLYIEQYRKAAELAAKQAETDATRAFDLESRRRDIQSKKASTLLEAIGGEAPSRQLLKDYVAAVNSDDPLAAAKFVKGLQDPGWWGKSQILRIAGLLSSTATHAVNMTGNVVNAALEIPTHALTVGIDAARAGVTGGERQAYKAELGPMAGAWGGGFLSKFPDAINILKTGVSPQDAIELGRGKVGRAGFASGNAAVDTAVEAPLRLLQAEDELFRGGGFAMQSNRVATRYAYQEGFRGRQLAGRAADIIANLESYPDLYKEANDATLRMLYQERRTVPMPMAMGNAMGSDISRGAISQILPFVKTPANITAQGFGMSPLGIAGVVEGLANRRNLAPAALGRQTLLTEQRLARTLIGSAIFGGFYALGMGALNGGKSALTGAYDPNEASTYPQGYREWSMVTQDPVTGNTYYIPFQNFGPAGVPMAMAAIVTDAHRRGQSFFENSDEQVKASTAIGQYVLDNTFLQGLSDTVNVLHDPSRYAPNFVQGLVASYGPYSAMGRQIQRAMGVASRNPHDGWQGLVDAMEANYPGLSGNVPEATTAIGEPRTQGISGAAAFALPIRADIARDDPTLIALRNADVQIPAAAKAVNVGNGYSINLTEDEQDQLKRARGAELRLQVQRVLDSDVYKRHQGDIGAENQLLQGAVSAASQNSDIRFVRSLSRADLQARAEKRTVPTPYTLAGTS